MNYLRTTALGIIALTLGTPASAVPPTPSPHTNPPEPRFVARLGRPAPTTDGLYAPRALREMRAYLRLRMLELREADLERVRAVIEHRLDVDALIDPSETPTLPPR
jgi:hypothetical protein